MKEKEELLTFLGENPQHVPVPGEQYYTVHKRKWLPWEEGWGFFQDGHYVLEWSSWKDILKTEHSKTMKTDGGGSEPRPILIVLEGLPPFKTSP